MYFGIYRRKRQLCRSIRIKRADCPLRLTVIALIIVNLCFDIVVVRVVTSCSIGSTSSVVVSIWTLERAPQQGTTAQFCLVASVVFAIIDEQRAYGGIAFAPVSYTHLTLPTKA